ncbi:protein FAR1-RELATED SEQUENCE 5-like [Silene latifolia]|uniref:protein FAR1-RELATED SEQUENCE 5-like n=1 Tax=Silene latifolia TaxID=37657 RepID=UPI003D77DB02
MEIVAYEAVENVIDDVLDETIPPVSEEDFCKQFEDVFTPYIGMEFGDIEEAITFYKVYALGVGFDVRKYTTKKWRDGTIKSKLLVCNREGFTKSSNESPGKEEDGSKQERRNKLKRIGCKARMRLFLKNGVLLVDRFHEEHNHELVAVKDREFQKLSKNISKYHMGLIVSNSRTFKIAFKSFSAQFADMNCVEVAKFVVKILKVKLNIGATRTYRMCKEVVNGYQNIGASLNDFKNFQRDITCFIHERDGQVFIDHFKNMAETRPDFYFDYDVDVDGSLRRAIWADGIARRNYSVFGDAVSYDPTYSTNKYKMVFTPFTGIDNHKRSITFCCALIAKETTESFNWVFERFLIAMRGKEPQYIITDQDPGIIASTKKFKTKTDRLRMWHIMNKVPCKYGSKRKDYQLFLKKLNAIVWDEELEAEEFENRWSAIMEEHVPADIEWFTDCYDIRRQWVMAHCKDLRMGGIMRTTQMVGK